MIAQFGKRALSFLLAVLMVFSVSPLQAFATEEEHEHDHGEEYVAEAAAEAAVQPEPVVVEEPQPPHTHSYAAVVTAPSCEAAGYTTYTCDCGDSYTSEEVPATGHSYESQVMAPTPEAQGYTQYTCACGDTYQADFVDYVPEETEPKETEHVHNHVAGEVVAPTAEAQGYTVYTCECGDTYNADFVDYVPEETEPEEEEPSALALDLTARINAILDTYGLTSGMTDDEIGRAITGKDWSVNKANIAEMNALEAATDEATETDKEYVFANADMETFGRFYNIWKPMFVVMKAAASGNHTPVEGVTVGVSGATDNSMTDGAITVTAKGSGGLFGLGASSKTATITLTNASGNTATVGFDWAATSVNELKIDGNTASGGNGSFSKLMEAGSQVTITITTAKNSTENKLVLSNFSLTEAASSSNVIFEFDSSLGSVTVGGTAITSGAVREVSLAEGVAVAATPSSDVTFLGWVDTTDGMILSTEASYTLTVVGDTTVKAAFAAKTSPAWFQAGSKLFDDLNEANAAGGTIVLAADGILPAGDYTISSGNTLLIPYNDANTVCTTSPADYGGDGYYQPTAYRTLTMANGANITVNGALSVSATESGQTLYNGHPSGPVGFIKMDSGSNITVNSGAFLYVWGYITGSGNVTVKGGGTVYENFQLTDWRGGSVTTDMAQDKTHRVLPMSSYYVQNVEVPMRLEAGCIEKGHMSVVISWPVGHQSAAVPFIGTDGMFQINSGYIIKDYIESEDRLKFEVHGDVGMQPLSISMKLGVLGSTTINSKNFNMPINSNITVHAVSGTISVTQDLALLPGSKMIIGENASCNLAEGGKIFVYDQDDWGGYLTQHLHKIMPLSYAPGRTCAPRGESSLVDAEVIINGTVNGSLGSLYTTAGGANVYSTGSGRVTMRAAGPTVTYQAVQVDTEVSYADISVTSAKLKNSDGTYTTTYDPAISTASTFVCENGTWRRICDGTNHVLGDSEERLDATCENAGYLRGTCVDCGTVVDETIPALGHTSVADTGYAATCETNGLTDGAHCSVCNEILTEQTVITALGHAWNETGTATTAATCTEPGVMTYTCKRDSNHTKNEAIPARNHDAGFNTTVISPTCDDRGYTLTECKYQDCAYESKTDYVEALGHQWGTVTYQRSADNTTWTASRTCRAGTTSAHTETATAQVQTNEVVAACKTIGQVTYSADFTEDWAVDQTETITGTTDPTNHENKVTVEGKSATCTEAGLTDGEQCTACDVWIKAQTTISALNHSYGEPTYTWSADFKTCTAQRVCTNDETHTETAKAAITSKNTNGVTVANCESGVETTYTATFTATWATTQTKVNTSEKNPENHTNIVDDPFVSATCTTPGKKAGQHCEGCGEITVPQAEIAALGHETTEKAEAIPATCLKPGVAGGMKCVACGVYTAGGQEITALGHDMVTDEAVAATCTTTGLTEGSHCSRCDEATTAQEVIPALEHNYVGKVTKEATCEKAGVMTYTCQNDSSHTYTEEITKLPHTEQIIPAVAPTCTATGLTAGKKCSVCGEILEAQEEVSVTEHPWDEGQQTTDPTCTAKGVMTFHCTQCEATKAEDIDALEHEITQVARKQPTCTEIGWIAYEYCTREGCDYTTYQELSTIAHSYKAVKTAPGCTTQGYTTYTCQNCEDQYVDNYVDAAGHSTSDWTEEVSRVEATCTEDGSYVEVTYCDICKGEAKRETIIIEKIPHTEAAAVKENEVAASCSKEGSYDNVIYCSICGEELSRETITVEKLAHTEAEAVEENTVDATCKAEGSYDSVVYCSVCGEELSRETITVEKLPHTEAEAVEENTVDATCKAEGSYDSVVYCSICGEELSREPKTIEKLAHTEAEAVEENTVDATCKAEGSYDSVVYCSVCGEELSRETITVEKLAHTEAEAVEENTVDATCKAEGSYESVVYCSVCKEELSRETITVDKVDHTYEDGACTGCGEAQPGVTVSGTVTSFNSDTDEVTVELFREGEETAAYSAVVTGNTAEYSISNVLEGTYTMKVSKKNHVTREYEVTVGKETVEQDVKICLIGDVNGNGTVNLSDYRAVLKHVKETALITDAYAVKCADVNGKNGVNISDYRAVLNHVKEIKPLF